MIKSALGSENFLCLCLMGQVSPRQKEVIDLSGQCQLELKNVGVQFKERYHTGLRA